MDNSRKTTLVMVLTANLILSVTVGIAMWNNNNKSTKQTKAGKETTPSTTPENTSQDASQKIVKPIYPATTKEAAVATARESAAKNNPNFPLALEREPSRKLTTAQAHESYIKQTAAAMQVPPPPPMAISTALPNVPVTPLKRVEPERITPSTPLNAAFRLAGIKLSGVIGQKAILLLRREGATRGERPEAICLAAGDRINTMSNIPVSIVKVDPDKVTLELGGNTYIKPLPDIH